MTSSPAGDLTLVWESDGQDGFTAGVYGQRSYCPGVAGEPDARAASVTLTVAPNPASSAAVVRWETAAPERVRIAVADVLGRTVAVLIDGEQSVGPHESRVDPSGLAPGVYVVRLVSGRRQATQPFTAVC